MSHAWVFSDKFLNESPSRKDGMTLEKEREMRSKTIWFLEDLGKELSNSLNKADQPIRFPRQAISCACVFFHRFYVFHSFQTYNRFNMALACLFLASKVEECPVKLKEIVNTYYGLKRAETTETQHKELHKQVLIFERILLCTLNFDLNLTHPYASCNAKIKEFKNQLSGVTKDDREEILQTSINLINDSYRTTLCLKFSSLEIACGAFFLATIKMNINPNPVNTVRGSGSTSALSNTSLSSSSGSSFGGGGASSSRSSWCELLEQDIDDASLKAIVTTMAELYDGRDQLSMKVQASFSSRPAPAPSSSSSSRSSKEEKSSDNSDNSSSSSSSSSRGQQNSTSNSSDRGYAETKQNNSSDNNNGNGNGNGNDGDPFFDDQFEGKTASTAKVTIKGATVSHSEYVNSVRREKAPPPHFPTSSSSSSSSLHSAPTLPPPLPPPVPDFAAKDSLSPGTDPLPGESPASCAFSNVQDTPSYLPPPSDTPEFPSLPSTPATYQGQSGLPDSRGNDSDGNGNAAKRARQN